MRLKGLGLLPRGRRGPARDRAAETFQPTMWTGEHTMSFEDELAVDAPRRQPTNIHARAEQSAMTQSRLERSRIQAHLTRWLSEHLHGVQERLRKNFRNYGRKGKRSPLAFQRIY